jgi:hypothetical protein
VLVDQDLKQIRTAIQAICHDEAFSALEGPKTSVILGKASSIAAHGITLNDVPAQTRDAFLASLVGQR